MRFLGVVGYVPAGAFELHGGRGDGLLDRAAAFRAFLDGLVGKLLDLFEAMAALLTLIFVKWHVFETVEGKLADSFRFYGGTEIASILAKEGEDHGSNSFFGAVLRQAAWMAFATASILRFSDAHWSRHVVPRHL